MPAAVAVANAAQSYLRKSDNSASSGGQSFYTGNGRDEEDEGIKIGGKKKSWGVILTILLTLFGGGAFLGSSNSLLAPAIESLFTTATDTQYASNALRSNRLVQGFLRYDTSGVTTKGWKGKIVYTKMSSSFKRKLSKNGISVVDKSTLSFTDAMGNKRLITADNFNVEFRDNIEFREAYSKSKRGRVMSFFDKIADKILAKLGISRNMFRSYKQTGDSSVDVENYRKTMSGHFDNDTSSLDIERRGTIENEDGTTTEVKENSSTDTKRIDGDTASVKAENTLKKVAESVGQIGNIACTVMKVGSMISAMVAANEIYQSINYFMGLSENISKMKAGQGDASAINEVLNFLSTSTDNKVEDFNNVSLVKKNEDDQTFEITAGEADQNGSPLESSGMQKVLANAKIDNNKTSGLYSLERAANSIGIALTNTATGATVCAGVQAVSAGISIVASIASLGTFAIASSIVSGLINVAVSVGIQLALGFLVPIIAQSMFTNAFENATGIPAGELFTRGASASNTRLGRSGSGQSAASESVALAYNQANNAVLALDAEIDRHSRSPFDTTNPNTFFGSIAYSLLPTITSSGFSSLTSFVRSTSTSLASLMSSVHAEGKDSTYMTSFGNCATLESIGAVGDIYCNPVTVTDLSTIDIDPFGNSAEDQKYNSIIEQNLDSNGNIKTNVDEGLAQYILYCANRESPFGIVDQNILGALQSTDGLGTFGNAVLGATPFLGDIFDILSAAEDTAHISIATGEICVANNSTYWQSKGKYYQRYVEDMRILDQLGSFEEAGISNPVMAFLDQYESEHPVDNSYEGYLARISGLTKEKVEITLAFIDYFNYIDEYEPESRIAMTEPLLNEETSDMVIARLEQEKPLRFENDSIVDETEPTLIAKEYIVYADIRNRSYTV